ncbi:class I SAM-dependent methyltransferase [Actinoalloteichus fjordicus]|uniref:Methyltransferase family protein n=1 Tax=Actinoalloteichus fjordicus TaxID=1612552 RepID=A0AAC9L8H6_9PSEU|nr:class I SAM-dependent methyltransferase [Actinoalloteichus fjordicus]APU13353.1 methyltransferase family protein [Actinoalloteichus fjordicus]
MSADHALVSLPLTGERTLPGIARENYWFRRHEAAYLALLPHCRGARVLDAGCGEGYGAAMLASVAEVVVAVDLDAPAVAHVGRAYPGVGAVRAELTTLPAATASVDVVANLQVIEHLWDQPAFMAECRRVLRPGGLLLLTTPNRLTFSPDGTTNPFHTRELDPAELAELLSDAGLVVDRLAGLRHGPALHERERRRGGSLIEEQIRLAVEGRDWPAELAAEVDAVRAEDFVITDTDVDTSLDLVAVGRRP